MEPVGSKPTSLPDRWRHLSGTKRCLFLIAVLLILAILGLNIYTMASVETGKEATCLRKDCPESEWRSLCLTRDCIESAGMIMDTMDAQVDPCEDFYWFACGNFLRRYSKIPEQGHQYWTQFKALGSAAKIAVRNILETKEVKTKSNAVRKMKTAYKSCIRSLNKEKNSRSMLLREIERVGLGKWPDNLLTWKDSDFDFESILSSLIVHQISSVFTINDNLWVACETPSESENPEVQEELKRTMETYFNLLSVPGKDSIILEILDFEKELKMIQRNVSWDKYDEDGKSPSEAEELYPEVNWTELIRKSMENVGVSGDPAKVKLKFNHNMTDLFAYVGQAPPRTLYNYLVWKFIEGSSKYLGPEFRLPKEMLDFREKYTAAKGATFEPNWKKCVDYINEMFPQAITAEYAKVMFSQNMYKEIKSYMTNIKKSFRKRIFHQTWLDEYSQKELVKKVDNITVVLAYPPSVMDIKSLDTIYKDIEVAEDSFLYNVLQIRKDEIRKAFLYVLYDEKFERSWDYDPTDINAFNMIWHNHIVIPISILYPPFFQFRRLRYLNYAAIGSVLGHEVGHSFDNNGIQLSYSRYMTEEGRPAEWLPEEIIKVFMDRAQCYAGQYSKFIIRELSENNTLQGNSSLPDNIADHVGLFNSYRAYVEYENVHGKEPGLPGLDFTNHQLFLLQYAQLFCSTYDPSILSMMTRSSHSPGEFRVKGPIINMPEFGDIFNCPKGSPMNPHEKCELWA